MSKESGNAAFQSLITISKDAEEFGFVWPNSEMILDQIRSECDEIHDSLMQREGRERVQEELGDLLQAVVELFLFLEIDIEESIDKTVQKFASRMAAVKGITHARGLKNLEGQSLLSILEIWRAAKKASL